MNPKVSIIRAVLRTCRLWKTHARLLNDLKIPFELNALSAHRTPDRVFEFARNALGKGIKVIIAGPAGLLICPGLLLLSRRFRDWVPIKSSNSIDGWDSILSILQMPAGIPVATVALNGSRNAAILAAQIIGTGENDVMERLLI